MTMREIKFRGYNRKNKQWLYGFYLQNCGHHFVCSDEFAQKGKSWDDYEVDSETVGQFTGLTDKNGREIYEGDVVRYSDESDDDYPRHGVVDSVVFEDGCFWPVSESWAHDKEVIGNIHDNPELLEQREQCELAKTLPSCDKSQQS